MTMSLSDYIEKNPISYTSKATRKKVVISPGDVIKVTIRANEYLNTIAGHFKELNFNIFATLGQRNISGFVGEVFSNIFAKNIDGFVVNPHGDGRPDLLDIMSEKAKKSFHLDCFERSEDGELFPRRSYLAPFKYGGLEVKSTIGSPVNNYKELLRSEVGVNSFSIGFPRINYLNSITYWGHHTSCENLLGLYYDYCEELDGTPQIMAVMQSELVPNIDWNLVSIGKSGSKKTSNTSLSTSGCTKIIGHPVIVRNDRRYLRNLSKIGLKI